MSIEIRCAYDKIVPIKELKAHPKNPNKHSKEQITRLAEIISYQGIRRPVRVSNLSGFITAGHGLVEALEHLGQKDAPVNLQDYQDEDQEYADIIADNAIAAWADLDLSAINLEVPNLGPDFDINMLGLKDFEIEAADKYVDKDADEVPEVKDAFVKLGELWSLGRHRLLCGDSTRSDLVSKVMNGEKADMVYTDPPYGMKFDFNYSRIRGSANKKLSFTISKKHTPVIGDDKDYDPRFIFETFDCDEIFLWGADYYCHRLLEEGGWLVWDKTGGQDSLMDAGFSSNFELCWSKQRHKRDIARFTWKGAVGRGGEGGVGAGTIHPTQKPIKLAEWFFERWGKDKSNIVDLYLGSGSTLIACEKTNRRCFGMEIDPHYCSVIIERWQKFTGLRASKVE